MEKPYVKSLPCVRALLCSLLLVVAMPGQALQVNDLYLARVAVANESGSERSRAFREALSAVVLKVTGDRRWLLEPSIEAAIADAQSYVEAVSYSSEFLPVQPPAGEEQSVDAQSVEVQGDTIAQPVAGAAVSLPASPRTVEQRYIEVEFSRELVQRLLQDAGIAVWESNRPSVLLWMILQDPEGERHFLTAESDPELIGLVEQFAEARGLPVLFPLMDFEDRQNLRPEQLWSLDVETIAAASARYGADSVLAGRLHFTATGELLGLWQFQFQGEAERFDGLDEELQAYLDPALDRVTTRLANYYAIPASDRGSSQLSLRVEDVRDLNDYAALMTYLRGLGLVEQVLPSRLDRQRIDLTLNISGDSRQLVELIQLDRDMLPLLDSDPLTQLHYRWTR